MLSTPLSRAQQQLLHQQQESYFSTGLSTPPPPTYSAGTPGATMSSPYLSGTLGQSPAAGDLHTPVRYYDSYSQSSYASPTFVSPINPIGVPPQVQQHEANLSGVRQQMSGYWPSPMSPSAAFGFGGRRTPPFGTSSVAMGQPLSPFAGHGLGGATSPIPINYASQHDSYLNPSSYSPSGAFGTPKKDGFEPMNTSPTVQQHQQQFHWQWNQQQPNMAPVNYPPGVIPVQFAPPQQHYSFFGNEPETPPPPPPALGRSSSMKDLSSGVGAKDVAAAAAAFNISKKLFESPPKAGTVTGSGKGGTKSGPPVFGLGNHESEDEDGPRILRHASSSPNLSLDKRRGLPGEGSGGKKSRQFGPSPTGSATSLSSSTPRSSSSAPASPAGSGGSAGNSPTISNWVTVFGFSTAAASYIISHFGQFGTILETKCVAGSNWIHIKYSNKFEARKALNKNGTVIGGNMMLGIMPYDSSVAENGIGGSPSGALTSSSGSSSKVQILPVYGARSGAGDGPSTSAGLVAGRPSTVQEASKEVKARIRPLSHTGYVGTNPLPRENNGIVSRALEFLFGW